MALNQPKLKRFKYEYPQSRPPYGWVMRWCVYEAEAKTAIKQAYEKGRADALAELRGAPKNE